jgi:hypothetical protein
MQYTFWTTLISTENRIPSLWAAVITNCSTLLLAGMLAHYSSLGWGAFVIAPLCCGLLFNYWYWPRAGARSIEALWPGFILRAPRRAVN